MAAERVAQLPDEPLLRFDRVRAGYGRLEVLKGVSLEMKSGELAAIIGPNGAGKSTVLKTIIGFLRPREGEVWFEGAPIGGRRPHELVRRGLAYVPQGRVTFPGMTVRENLEMGAFTLTDRRRVAESMDYVHTLFPRLAERPTQLAGTMSGGEQQMLSIGRALMTRPRLLMLDEPSLGLAPKFVDMVFDQMLLLKSQGLALALVEQNAARALEIADRAYVLDLGENKYEGTGRQLAGDDRIKRMYLGG